MSNSYTVCLGQKVSFYLSFKYMKKTEVGENDVDQVGKMSRALFYLFFNLIPAPSVKPPLAPLSTRRCQRKFNMGPVVGDVFILFFFFFALGVTR